ncbi:uncharacterized protein PFL1_00699 [Pseudozyma flocculosa PF-1]|uniref:Related to galactoside O-acetyltransferase n=1 Tax=Pseudozyma flocculosa TaxID=84751 RepID=A0A5C3F4J7_9BASI|nr:uncharacterized protein PFL1_00699 [Pseudozyma flocculosa PF-1]EPQ31364.1 hypothetical protein PFL1_00699 [Pseudozyma flocculosa PF-1]SPO38855.1 related to galactoside O-acetyltransferase [Pseudozyma flocculosa]
MSEAVPQTSTNGTTTNGTTTNGTTTASTSTATSSTKPSLTATQKFAAADEQYAARLSGLSQGERSLLGLPYLCTDAQLTVQRLRARQLEYDYNHSRPGPSPPTPSRCGTLETDPTLNDVSNAQRTAILSDLFHLDPQQAKRIFIEPPLHVDFGFNVAFKGDFYANAGLVILDVAPVSIGHGVLFGPAVHIYAATHSVSVTERASGYERALPVAIGDDCWIGGNVCIMAGVTIGRGCTIGAGSVVTRDIPDWSVAVGNPARVVKTLTEDERGLKLEGKSGAVPF